MDTRRWSTEYDPLQPNSYTEIKARLTANSTLDNNEPAPVNVGGAKPSSSRASPSSLLFANTAPSRGPSRDSFSSSASRWTSPVTVEGNEPITMKPAIFAMMRKMGYEKGRGLGATCQGRLDPVGVLGNDGRDGLGKVPPKLFSPERQQPTPIARRKPASKRVSTASRTLVIRNVSRSDASKLEMKCAEFGALSEFSLKGDDLGTDGALTTDSSIFAVAFRESLSSTRAALALQGMMFRGKELRVSVHAEHSRPPEDR